MMTEYEKKMIAIREEELRLQRIAVVTTVAQLQLNLTARRRANRSWYEKLEDTLFG